VIGLPAGVVGRTATPSKSLRKERYSMTRNLKTLCLALVAMLAMSAGAVSAAQAAPGELHSEVAAGKTSAILTGDNVGLGAHEMTIKGFVLKCQSASFEGTVQKTTTDATVTPQYTGCLWGGLAAQFKMNGCKYTLTGVADFTANIDIVGCTAGKSIEIVDVLCTVTVPEQKEIGHVVFTNTAGPPKDIHASVTLTGITYIGDGEKCGAPEGHHADGTLTGTTTIRAYEDLGLNALTEHNGHKYQPFKEGAQVGLFTT
jgi:hypothetical protein